MWSWRGCKGTEGAPGTPGQEEVATGSYPDHTHLSYVFFKLFSTFKAKMKGEGP